MPKKIARWAAKLFSLFASRSSKKLNHMQPVTGVVIERPHHTISRASINSNAMTVLYRLKEAGYAAYLVGGSVRDILLGREPKDFDIATDARPEAVRRLFRNSRIIGRRFRLVHVFFHGDIIEVSTFRANTIEQTRHDNQSGMGMIYRDNTFGTIEEDAWRRDFTVNALYYNIADFSIVDYMYGMQDLKQRVIRMIGDPAQRYHEDPVRLLRAIRLSAKLNFNIEHHTEIALKKLMHLLQHVPNARLFDECLKLFFEGNAHVTYQKLAHYDFLTVLFPQLAHILQHDQHSVYHKMIDLAMRTTDARIKSNDSVNPGYLLAVLLWPVLQIQLIAMKNKNDKFFMKLHQLSHDVIERQLQAIMIPKRLQFMMQTMWVLQFQLEKRRPKRIFNLFQHRYFRAAVDFLELRVQAGEIKADVYEWWKAFQWANVDDQKAMIQQLW